MASYARAAAVDTRAEAATESDDDEAAREEADLKAAIQAPPCRFAFATDYT